MDSPMLMIPGPTDLPDEVREALARPMINHRGREFAELIGRTTAGLQQVFRTENDLLTLTASGTGGMEAAVACTLSPGDRVVILDIGNFGERWAKIASRFQLEADVRRFERGAAADPAVLQQAIKEADGGLKAVLWTHNETSTATVNDSETLSGIAKGHGLLTIVDNISGMGACEFRVDKWNLDVVVAGSQKALMLPPGLAFVSMSEAAWEAEARSTSPRFYFDLRAARESLSKGQTPYTPNVTLLFALDAALELLLEEGLDEVWSRHARMAAGVRAAVPAMNLELFGDRERPSPVVTAISAPSGIDPQEILGRMHEEEGIDVARGQGELGSKIFRLGHLGMIDEERTLRMLKSVERVLQRMGHKCEAGGGAAAAQKAWAEGEGA